MSDTEQLDECRPRIKRLDGSKEKQPDYEATTTANGSAVAQQPSEAGVITSVTRPSIDGKASPGSTPHTEFAGAGSFSLDAGIRRPEATEPASTHSSLEAERTSSIRRRAAATAAAQRIGEHASDSSQKAQAALSPSTPAHFASHSVMPTQTLTNPSQSASNAQAAYTQQYLNSWMMAGADVPGPASTAHTFTPGLQLEHLHAAQLAQLQAQASTVSAASAAEAERVASQAHLHGSHSFLSHLAQLAHLGHSVGNSQVHSFTPAGGNAADTNAKTLITEASLRLVVNQQQEHQHQHQSSIAAQKQGQGQPGQINRAPSMQPESKQHARHGTLLPNHLSLMPQPTNKSALAGAMPSPGANGSAHAGKAAPKLVLKPDSPKPSGKEGQDGKAESNGEGQLDNEFTLFPEDEEEEDESVAADDELPWYRSRTFWWAVSWLSVSAVLLCIGLILHQLVGKKFVGSQSFRWFYFFAGVPVLYYSIRIVLGKIFMLIEWYFFREALYYLSNVQFQSTRLLLVFALLPWFQTCFTWAWCKDTSTLIGRCSQPAYERATLIVWRVLLCIMLWCLANWIKCVLAKMLSTHFYRTAHFKKLRVALEKEYYLQILSRPRARVLEDKRSSAEAAARAQAAATTANLNWLHSVLAAPSMGKQLLAHISHTYGHGVQRDNQGEANLARSSVTRMVIPAPLPPPGSDVAVGTDAAGATLVAAGASSAAADASVALKLSAGHVSSAMGQAYRQSAAGTPASSSNGLPPLPPSRPFPIGMPPPGWPLGSTGPAGRGGAMNTSTQVEAARSSSESDTKRSLHDVRLDVMSGPGPSLGAWYPQQQLSQQHQGVSPMDNGLSNAPSAASAVAGQAVIPPAGGSGAGSGDAGNNSVNRMSAGLTGYGALPSQLTESGVHINQSKLSPSGSVARSLVGQQPAAAGATPALQQPGMIPEIRQMFANADAQAGKRADSITSKRSHRSKMSRLSAKKGGLAKRAGPNDTSRDANEVLTEEMVETVPHQLTDKKDMTSLSQEEMEKVRTAIVIKTYTALIRRHADMSDERQELELKKVKRFAKALFYNVSGAAEQLQAQLKAVEAMYGSPVLEGGPGHTILDPVGDLGGEGLAAGKPIAEGVATGAQQQQQPARAAAAVGNAPGAVAAAAATAPPPTASSTAAGLASSTAALDAARIAPSTATAGNALPTDTSVSTGAGMGTGSGVDGVRSARPSQPGDGKDQQAAVLADFELFFGNQAMAKKAFDVFTVDGKDKVSRADMKERVLGIYKERRNQALSLKDTDSIVNSLEFGLGGLIHFVFAAVYLLIWGVDLLTGFSTFSATVLALTFVFGNSIKNTFESMLFLFVIHPYDVGDMLLLGTESLRVKKISLLYTEMLRWNGERVFVPNPTLFTTQVTNLTRSKTKSETVRLVMDFGVASTVREDIQDALRAYVKEHPTDFDGQPTCNFREVVDPMKVVMTVSWTYNCAPDEYARIAPLRNALLTVLQDKIMEHHLMHTAVIERIKADKEKEE